MFGAAKAVHFVGDAFCEVLKVDRRVLLNVTEENPAGISSDKRRKKKNKTKMRPRVSESLRFS